MSLLGFYPLNGTVSDISYNYGYGNLKSDDNTALVTFGSFGIGNAATSNIVGKLIEYYNIYLNEFSISFMYKFTKPIPTTGTQILSSNNFGLVVYPSKLILYKGQDYIEGTSNKALYDKIEYVIELTNSVKFISMGFDKDKIYLHIDGMYCMSINNTTSNMITKKIIITNLGFISNLILYDDMPSDKIIFEMYKNKLFQYNFNQNLNNYPEMLNLVRNGNMEELFTHWTFGTGNIPAESIIYDDKNQAVKFLCVSRGTGTSTSMTQTITGLVITKTYWLSYKTYNSVTKLVENTQTQLTNISSYILTINSSNDLLYVKDIMISETKELPYNSFIPYENNPVITVYPNTLKVVDSTVTLLNKKQVWSDSGLYGNGSLLIENFEILFPELLIDSGNYIIELTVKMEQLNASTPLITFKSNNTNLLFSITDGKFSIGTTKMSSCVLNTWYSIVIVISNGTIFKIYIDDVLATTYTNPTKCNKIEKFGFNNTVNCKGLLDKITLFYQYKDMTDNDINEMYLNSDIISTIDNKGNLWVKAYDEISSPNDTKMYINSNNLSVTIPTNREIGKDVRYIKISCDDTINTLSPRLLDIIKIECIVDGDVIKTISGTQISTPSGIISLSFDLGALYNIELFKVYFNPNTNNTIYVNKQIRLSIDNVLWSSPYFPYDNNRLHELINIPTEFLLYDNTLHINGDLNIINTHGIYQM